MDLKSWLARLNMSLSGVMLRNSIFTFANLERFLRAKGFKPPPEQEFNEALKELGRSSGDQKPKAQDSTQNPKATTGTPKAQSAKQETETLVTKKKSPRKKSTTKKNEKSKS